MAKSKSLRGLILGSALAVLTTAVAVADGYFPNFPVVNGASYCSGFSQAGVPGTTPVCNATVPAGPTALTGNETFIADTHLASGQSPQTVAVKPASMGVGPYVYNAPLTGASITMTAQQRRLVLEPAGTIAALTVVFPAASTLTDGQLISLCSTQIVTALTITPGSGTTVSNTVTALAVPVATGAASCPEWVYRQANTNWYRTQ